MIQPQEILPHEKQAAKMAVQFNLVLLPSHLFSRRALPIVGRTNTMHSDSPTCFFMYWLAGTCQSLRSLYLHKV
jgi:hypothetical protein